MISKFMIDLIKARLMQFPTGANGWSFYVAGIKSPETNISNFFESVACETTPLSSSEVVQLFEKALECGRYDAVSTTIALGFSWTDSPEGYDFWLPVAMCLKSYTHDYNGNLIPETLVSEIDLDDYTEMALNNFVWAKRQ